MTTRLALVLALGLVASAATAQEAPGWNDTPYAGTLTLNAGFPDDPRTLAVRPGGSNANPINGSGCVGYIGSRPDVVVEYRAGSWDLTFSAASDTDLTMVVRDPYGRYVCDDDAGEGTNPVVTVERPASGRYAVWVGVYSSANEYVDGVFGVSEVGNEVVYGRSGGVHSGASTPPSGSQAGSRAGEIPGWNGPASFGTMSLNANFSGDPRTWSVNAGGPYRNPIDGPGCTGYIAYQPDLKVNYGAGSWDLTFSAASATDLTLVVRTPSGQYLCDDDSGEGNHPRIDVRNPESGGYVIWVGTFSVTDRTVPSTVGVSEVGAEAH